METGFEFPERRNDTIRARRRLRLCFVALLACVLMMADLISDASTAIHAQNLFDHSSGTTAIEHRRSPVETDATGHNRL